MTGQGVRRRRLPHHPRRRLLRERFPRPVLLGAVALVAVANTFNIGADIGSMAAAAGLLVPVPHTLAAVAFALVMIALELGVPYHRYARVLRWLARGARSASVAGPRLLRCHRRVDPAGGGDGLRRCQPDPGALVMAGLSVLAVLR